MTGKIKVSEEKFYITTLMVMWWGKFQETDGIFFPNSRKIQAIFQKLHTFSKYNSAFVIIIIIIIFCNYLIIGHKKALLCFSFGPGLLLY